MLMSSRRFLFPLWWCPFHWFACFKIFPLAQEKWKLSLFSLSALSSHFNLQKWGKINFDGYVTNLMTQQCIEELWLLLLGIDVWAEIETMTSSRDDAPRWWSAVMTSWRWAEIYEQRWAMVQKSWWDEQRRWAALICQRFLVGYMNLLYCKSKLVLLLRLGYLKPFLAGSKKTRQGPGYRVGADFTLRL